jgi:tetratricopeptide (TPR) repeat protein
MFFKRPQLISYPSSFRVFLLVSLGIVFAGGFLGYERMRTDRHLLAALNYRTAGNWAAVLESMEAGRSSFSVLDPTGTPFAWYAGSARYALGDYAGALADFQQAHRANPHHLHVLNNLCATWVQLGMPDSGLAYCQRATELSPLFSEAWTNLGIIHYNAQRLDLAEQALLGVPDTVPTPLTAQLAEVVVASRIQSLLPEVEEAALRGMLEAIAAQPAWKRLIYEKAHLNRISLRRQLFLDAIFNFVALDSSRYFSLVDSLERKYIDPRH